MAWTDQTIDELQNVKNFSGWLYCTLHNNTKPVLRYNEKRAYTDVINAIAVRIEALIRGLAPDVISQIGHRLLGNTAHLKDLKKWYADAISGSLAEVKKEYHEIVAETDESNKQIDEQLIAVLNVGYSYLSQLTRTISEKTAIGNPAEFAKERIEWLGTAGEFSAIFKELMDGGYIGGLNKDWKNMVSSLKDHFQVNGKDGQEITEKHLTQAHNKANPFNALNKLSIPEAGYIVNLKKGDSKKKAN